MIKNVFYIKVWYTSHASLNFWVALFILGDCVCGGWGEGKTTQMFYSPAATLITVFLCIVPIQFPNFLRDNFLCSLNFIIWIIYLTTTREANTSPYSFGKIFKGELVFFVIEKKKSKQQASATTPSYFSHEINFTAPNAP